jgi:tetratricopeptide (TPR) repeat protein
MSDNLKQIDDILNSDTILESSQKQKLTDFSNLLNNLENLKNEGNKLYKKKQLEEAKTKFYEGYKLFEKESSIIYNEFYINEQCESLIIIYKKILSNLALCYYKQENYNKSIEFDLKLIALEPKFGKSIVRLFNSYSKINKNQQAIFYGELFMDLNKEIRIKFKDTEQKIFGEKIKLNKLQTEEESRIKKNIYILCSPIIILILSAIIYKIFKK